jgi:hypothetical protein
VERVYLEAKPQDGLMGQGGAAAESQLYLLMISKNLCDIL